MPPPQLIDFIITHLQRGPPPQRETQMRGDRRAEKRARADVQESVLEGVNKERNAATSVGKRAQARKIHAPPVVVPRLSGEVRLRLIQMHCRLVLRSEAKIAASGASSLRVLLLGRLLRLATDGGIVKEMGFVQEMIDFIVAELGTRLEIALGWLHVEAARGLLFEADQEKSFKVTPVRNEYICLTPDERHIKRHASGVRPNISHCYLLSQRCVEGKNIESESTGEPPDAPTLVIGGAEATREAAAVQENGQRLCSHQITHTGLVAVGNLINSAIEGDHGVDCETKRCIESTDDSSMDSSPLPRFSVGSNYDALLSCMLKSASEKLGPEDRLLSRLVVEAPALTDGAIDVVVTHCRDAARSRLGLSTLRDIIIERPGPDRDRCLEVLLGFTTDEDDVLRGPAIRLVASKLFEDMSGAVPAAIEMFALKAVNDALEEQSKISSSEDTRDTNESVYGPLERNMWLLSALCVKKNALLADLANFYLRASDPAKMIFLSRAKDVAGQIGPNSSALIAFIRGENNECASNIKEFGDLALVLTSASIGRNSVQIPPELVEAVHVRYDKTKDARFLRVILTGLKRKEIVQYLNVLISMRAPAIGNESDRILGIAPSDIAHGNGFKAIVREIMGARTRPISPTDLIVELHVAQISADICAALKTCLELKVIFKETDIACALQKLIAMEMIPELLMRTVVLTHVHHPSLDQFVREAVLIVLVRRKFWCNKLLWTGFLQYCAETRGSSIGLLGSLPRPQLVDLLSQQHELGKVVLQKLNSKEIRMRRTVRSHLAAALFQARA
jgi:hypothetical protein